LMHNMLTVNTHVYIPQIPTDLNMYAWLHAKRHWCHGAYILHAVSAHRYLYTNMNNKLNAYHMQHWPRRLHVRCSIPVPCHLRS
jgi:hypothetical protein